MSYPRRISRKLALARRHRRRADKLHRASIWCAKKMPDAVYQNEIEARRSDERARRYFEQAISLIYEEANG